MSSLLQPNVSGRPQSTQTAVYNGYDSAGSVVNADVPKGAVLQYQNTADNKVGRTVSGNNNKLVFLSSEYPDPELSRINNQAGVVANLRDGGPIQVVDEGLAYLYCSINATVGMRLVATAGSFALSTFSAGTVDAFATRLGAGSEPVAIAKEAVDRSGTPGLVLCEIIKR